MGVFKSGGILAPGAAKVTTRGGAPGGAASEIPFRGSGGPRPPVVGAFWSPLKISGGREAGEAYAGKDAKTSGAQKICTPRTGVDTFAGAIFFIDTAGRRAYLCRASDNAFLLKVLFPVGGRPRRPHIHDLRERESAVKGTFAPTPVALILSAQAASLAAARTHFISSRTRPRRTGRRRRRRHDRATPPERGTRRDAVLRGGPVSDGRRRTPASGGEGEIENEHLRHQHRRDD
jgi:hypothetical protein